VRSATRSWRRSLHSLFEGASQKRHPFARREPRRQQVGDLVVATDVSRAAAPAKGDDAEGDWVDPLPVVVRPPTPELLRRASLVVDHFRHAGGGIVLHGLGMRVENPRVASGPVEPAGRALPPVLPGNDSPVADDLADALPGQVRGRCANEELAKSVYGPPAVRVKGLDVRREDERGVAENAIERLAKDRFEDVSLAPGDARDAVPPVC